MTTRGYQNYRGKKSGKRILLVVVLILVLILCAGYLILKVYIVYDSSVNFSFYSLFLAKGSLIRLKPTTAVASACPLKS